MVFLLNQTSWSCSTLHHSAPMAAISFRRNGVASVLKWSLWRRSFTFRPQSLASKVGIVQRPGGRSFLRPLVVFHPSSKFGFLQMTCLNSSPPLPGLSAFQGLLFPQHRKPKLCNESNGAYFRGLQQRQARSCFMHSQTTLVENSACLTRRMLLKVKHSYASPPKQKPQYNHGPSLADAPAPSQYLSKNSGGTLAALKLSLSSAELASKGSPSFKGKGQVSKPCTPDLSYDSNSTEPTRSTHHGHSTFSHSDTKPKTTEVDAPKSPPPRCRFRRKKLPHQP